MYGSSRQGPRTRSAGLTRPLPAGRCRISRATGLAAVVSDEDECLAKKAHGGAVQGTEVAPEGARTGFPPEQREDVPRALEPFVQLHDHLNKSYAGTGLGLPMVQALIRLHGGTITIDSREGDGTTVTLRFPRRRVIKIGVAAV